MPRPRKPDRTPAQLWQREYQRERSRRVQAARVESRHDAIESATTGQVAAEFNRLLASLAVRGRRMKREIRTLVIGKNDGSVRVVCVTRDTAPVLLGSRYTATGRHKAAFSPDAYVRESGGNTWSIPSTIRIEVGVKWMLTNYYDDLLCVRDMKSLVYRGSDW